MSEKEENGCSIRDEVTEDTQTGFENDISDDVTEDTQACFGSATSDEVTEDTQACLEKCTDSQGSDDDADLDQDIDALSDCTQSNTVNFLPAVVEAIQAKDMEALNHLIKTVVKPGLSPCMFEMLESEMSDFLPDSLKDIFDIMEVYEQSEDQCEMNDMFNSVMQRILTRLGVPNNTELGRKMEASFQEVLPLFMQMVDNETNMSEFTAVLKYESHHHMDGFLSSDTIIKSLPAENPWHLLSKEEKDIVRHIWSTAPSSKTKKFLQNRYGNDVLLNIGDPQLEKITAMNNTENCELVCGIVESVEAPQRAQFLLTLNSENHTVLHVASMMGRTDVVAYYVSLGIDEEKFLLAHDCSRIGAKLGSTALHFAGNKQIAELLVNAVSSEKREEFVWMRNNIGLTALHVACNEGKADIARYLLSLWSAKRGWSHLFDGYTPLHCARSLEIARCLMEFATEDPFHTTPSYYICEREPNNGETALHTASQRGLANVARFLVAVEPLGYQLPFIQDIFQHTPLHMACNAETVEAILETIDEEGRRSYIAAPNNLGQTVLHVASQHGRTNVICCIMKPVYEQAFNLQDKDGNTPLLTAVSSAQTDTAAVILQYFSSDETKLKKQLRATNDNGQNVFHLASRYFDAKTNFENILREYEHLQETYELNTLDVFGNSQIHYLLGTQKLQSFAGRIMRIPLALRRQILRVNNHKQQNCHTILNAMQSHDAEARVNFFLLYVANFSYSGLDPYLNLGKLHPALTLDPRLLTVMKYALHEYSLTDVASTALLKLSSGFQQKQNNLWLFIDDCVLGNEIGPKKIQQEVRNMDTPVRHGMPKVVVRRRIDRTLNIHPPGPDYVIITATHRFKKTENISSWPDESLPTSDTRKLIEVLCHDENVHHVTVNSTFGKHYVLETERLCRDSSKNYLISEDNRGQALVFCTRAKRGDWQTQHDDAVFILERHIGLKVTLVYDRTADQMVEEINKFAYSTGHGKMAALVIMSHGDCDGNIAGVDGKSLAVQTVVKEFCSNNLDDIPKVIMLSFCRGGIVASYNRIADAFEVTELPSILESSEFAPSTTRLPKKLKEDEHKVHPFPDAEVPVNCHLFFTTLPDSKSPREGIVFKEMRKYLHTISQLGDFLLTEDNHERLDDVKGSEEQQKQSPAGHKEGPLVELVKMFTDVAGEVRERSQFKLYTNHCYTVNKDSKPVVIEVLK